MVMCGVGFKANNQSSFVSLTVASSKNCFASLGGDKHCSNLSWYDLTPISQWKKTGEVSKTGKSVEEATYSIIHKRFVFDIAPFSPVSVHRKLYYR
jgi:hypothetical protein